MDNSQHINVGLLSPEAELASWLYEDVGCEVVDGQQMCSFSSRQLRFEGLESESLSGDALNNVNVLVGLIRFVDVLSLQKMDQLLNQSGAVKKIPSLMLIYRNENETDFKMSCPFCGQKLWVRDVDQDKRGRCPHCSKGFTLPDQEDHLHSTLRLPPAVQVRKIVRQDPGSLAGPLRDIIQLASVESSLHNLVDSKQSVINDTMKVNVVGDSGD